VKKVGRILAPVPWEIARALEFPIYGRPVNPIAFLSFETKSESILFDSNLFAPEKSLFFFKIRDLNVSKVPDLSSLAYIFI